VLKDKITRAIDTSTVKNKAAMKALLLPSIGFKLISTQAIVEFSKIGGYPSITRENWPSFSGKPLLFVGQISLDEISSMNSLLPRNGFLYFFLLTDNIGFRYPDRRGEFKVVYDKFTRQKLSTEVNNSIREYSISFFEYYTFPSYQEDIIQQNQISDNDVFQVKEFEHEMLNSVGVNSDIAHQLLGHPDAIQGTVRFWWAAKYLGFGERTSFSVEETKLIKNEESKFVLLLQLNFGDPKIEVSYFGDSVAYFGIHEKDLQNGDFDNTVLVMQNT
jgi:uncharacterized protein YwqG